MVAFFYLEKITFCAFLFRPELNNIFHWYAQSCIFNSPLLSVKAEVFPQVKMLNKEISSEFSPCGRFFI